ncbi:MAG: hypothetical protein APG12_00432 [Candidatus Methanofastidiosum methylothiophilum]|uniref:Uncharacterized protein n=1 Tax=Candidatus Methanofastidiosum methylothiophilum TaxID=1705564 RepID=A0A150IHM2_9EURY|nr:MAG: hypothetical protein APG10_01754 [Candidatus Methanofastidiosum methylthiophilus]KYC46532.1 MAG: hypothetical protein APG11_01838 [Candidatus Methanofastidiosum methylthiophilus]KYC51008.1 MAG: hypothetical protein APG12_00432 [Candidatus Methanofastidiosum methylthiophilus]
MKKLEIIFSLLTSRMGKKSKIKNHFLDILKYIGIFDKEFELSDIEVYG